MKSMQDQLMQNQNQMLNKDCDWEWIQKESEYDLHGVHIANANGCCYQIQLHQEQLENCRHDGAYT